MDNTINELDTEQEWQWCLVGNIVEKHKYGEEHIIKYGNKQFRPNAKVYVNLIYFGMGHETILVIGTPRHSSKYIEISKTDLKYIKHGSSWFNQRGWEDDYSINETHRAKSKSEEQFEFLKGVYDGTIQVK